MSDGDGPLQSEASAAEMPGSTHEVVETAEIDPRPLSQKLSRNTSFSNTSSCQENYNPLPQGDKPTIFDVLDSFSLAERLEKWQQALNAQGKRVKERRDKLKSTSTIAKDRVVGEWKKRVPTADEQLEKYRQHMKHGVEKLGKQWNDIATVTLRENISFIAGVFNIFISGYLIGARPEYFYFWYTLQLAYFMPIRYYIYHKKGYQYFLADLCYFANLLCILSIWVFPQSKRLFISAFCLAFGNNAVAIALWRNSLVFHSHDKVVRYALPYSKACAALTMPSVFIHIMPPAALHCIVHLTPAQMLKNRFPAVYSIKFSEAGSPEHYSLASMMVWATVPYFVWQLAYHLLITVRRADKIAAGRPTSFTWLRKSYANTMIGKLVLSLPEPAQEPAFMMVQYTYAMLTVTPCPIWFWYKWASAVFMMSMFGWSVHNGATYYIDIFGKRFQRELEELKRNVAQWQSSSSSEGSIEPVNVALAELSPVNTHGHGKPESHDATRETSACANLEYTNHSDESTTRKRS